MELLWPPADLAEYGGSFSGTSNGGNWGETINGNSVTFRLVYDDFEMLFTGDHNDESQPALREAVGDGLSADVLKVPHHGSSHGERAFFDAVDPVVSVASMGAQGFRTNWRHPSEDVIRWLGGSHRVFHTLIHEKRFKYDQLQGPADFDKLEEFSHILIETDGEWFRVVKVPVGSDPGDIPTVQATRRGNGTRWIRAR